MGFRFQLGQQVSIAVSGEQGSIKGRAEYRASAQQYLIHYCAADGRAVDAWFEEGEITPVNPG